MADLNTTISLITLNEWDKHSNQRQRLSDQILKEKIYVSLQERNYKAKDKNRLKKLYTLYKQRTRVAILIPDKISNITREKMYSI